MAFSAVPSARSRRGKLFHHVARHLLVGSAAALALATSSCNKAEPKGQVIAVANGEEITVPELNEEARARGLSIGDNTAVRDGVVRDLVDRKLLVQEALKEKIDRNPEHLLAARRLNELLLVQELLAAHGASGDPSQAELLQFISSHPHGFDQRVAIRVAQISVPTKLPAKVQAELSTATSLDDAQRQLAGARIKGTRSEQEWDSADLSEDTAENLLDSNGELTLLPAGQGMAVVQVLSVTPRPVPPEQRISTARQWLTQQRASDALNELIARARSSAHVEYHQGFKPDD